MIRSRYIALLLISVGLLLGLGGPGRTAGASGAALDDSLVYYDLQNDACAPLCRRTFGTQLDADGLWLNSYGDADGEIYIRYQMYIGVGSIYQTITLGAFVSYKSGFTQHAITFIAAGREYMINALYPGTYLERTVCITPIVSGWVPIRVVGGRFKIAYVREQTGGTECLGATLVPGPTATGTMVPWTTATPLPDDCGIFGQCGFIATPTRIPISNLNIAGLTVDRTQQVKMAQTIVSMWQFGDQNGLLSLLISLALAGAFILAFAKLIRNLTNSQ